MCQLESRMLPSQIRDHVCFLAYVQNSSFGFLHPYTQVSRYDLTGSCIAYDLDLAGRLRHCGL